MKGPSGSRCVHWLWDLSITLLSLCSCLKCYLLMEVFSFSPPSSCVAHRWLYVFHSNIAQYCIHVFSSATVCSSNWSEQTWKEAGDVSDSETEARILKCCSYIRKDGWTAAMTRIFDAKSERDEKFKEMREKDETDKISQAGAATLA